jgi:hypothetical protein
MAKRKKDPKRELGEKCRSGRLISEYIRAIGSELTETVLDDSPECPGPPRLVSKAEALARHVWRKALPHRDDEGQLQQPDLDYVKMVFDRADGRPVAPKDGNPDQNESIPDKIARLSVGRLNGFAEEAVEEK